MTEQKSFKERVKETVIQNAYSYKKYFVDYEYLLFSTAFMNNEYYIVSAYNDNYLHLTGLHTSLNASDFFEKCYTGTLEECDFDFCKSGQNESEVKGNELNSAKAKKLDLVFRRKSGENRFTEMLIGDENRLLEHKDTLANLLSEELLSFINTDVKTEE